jgi:hypothetical protein
MTRVLLAGMSAMAVLSGSSSSPPGTDGVVPSAPTVQVSVDSSHLLAMCPMSVPGTQVIAADAVNGGTLTFTTTGEIEELRIRVMEMAQRHNAHHADTGEHSGMGRGGMMASENPLGSTPMPPSWATVVEVERGAMIVVVPNESGDLARLQSAIRTRAERMQRNGCDLVGQALR